MRSKPSVFRLRAHHIGCTLLEMATRKGDHPAVPAAAKRLAEDRRGLIQVLIGPDDICRPCPHWARGACDRGFEALNRLKDERFLVQLGIRDGAVLAAEDLIHRFCARADRAFLGEVCAGCTPDACADAAAAVAHSLARRRR